MRERTLVAATTPPDSTLTACCNAELDGELCFDCETVPPARTEFSCSCGTSVVNLGHGWLECVGCGARWGADADLGSKPTSWDPARADHVLSDPEPRLHDPILRVPLTWDDLFAKVEADL
ncbi:hypothetical protein ACFVAJ_18490 [Agromyces sp. NPDC057679]|uniref:hypothetical protein n=1 Tax=Agromyces sp. NPDC057679 TaxID=3346207 RepID=UPI00366A8813